MGNSNSNTLKSHNSKINIEQKDTNLLSNLVNTNIMIDYRVINIYLCCKDGTPFYFTKIKNQNNLDIQIFLLNAIKEYNKTNKYKIYISEDLSRYILKVATLKGYPENDLPIIYKKIIVSNFKFDYICAIYNISLKELNISDISLLNYSTDYLNSSDNKIFLNTNSIAINNQNKLVNYKIKKRIKNINKYRFNSNNTIYKRNKNNNETIELLNYSKN